MVFTSAISLNMTMNFEYAFDKIECKSWFISGMYKDIDRIFLIQNDRNSITLN